MNPPTSGSIPLQEYRRDIPPGWIPGDASYPLRTYFDKLKLWYRIANVEDEAIGPLVAGRLYGRASTIAMSLRAPRPDGTFDVGDAALVRLAVDEVRDPATNVIIQNHIPSGVQFLANALRTAFGQQDQDLATQALDKFFGLARGKLSLSEYSVEFDSRYDDAHDRAGLQLNDVGKFFLWFKNSGLPSKTVDDIKLQVAGDYTRFNDARALALRINPNRREPDDAQILYEENDESYGDYDAYYQDWGDDYEAEDSWWYGYEEADEGEWVYEEYANDENYYENHDASDESWQEVDLEAGMTSGSASDSNVSGEYNEAYYKGKGNGSDDGCFNCGSKFHRVRDCPLGKGKNKKGSHNYKGKGKSKGFWRWRPNFKGKSKGKSKHPWRSKGKGKGKGFGRKGHYYAYQEEDNYKPRGGLSISEGIPDASTPQEVATSSKEVKTTKKTESFVIHTSSEDEDFKKPTEGYSGQPEYTTKDHYDKKLKMNFMVFNMKKEETQMSYHTIHGQERYGLLIDPGAASGLVGSETLRMLKSCSMGEMEINRNKITPVSGISGNSESTLGEVTLTMATAGQPITYTAEVIGGAGSLCPALVGNPTLRRLGASILTDWFENGDGMLVLNTKDAMDAEVNHVKFFRILLTDSGHYILPCDNVQNEKVPRASKHEAIAFFQKITEITSKVWPDVQPRVRHCFHSQTAAEDDRCDYNREHERDKGPMKSQDHDVGCDHLACENGEEDELRNPVPSRKIHFIDEEQQKKSEEPYDLMNSEKNKSLSPIAEERDSEDEVSPSAILAEQCMKNDKSKEPAKNSNHLINEHPAGPAILAPAIHDEQGLREASYDEEKNVFLSYTGDMIPETADQAELYEGVEIKNLTSKALSVPTTHMLKKLLLETINATMGVFNEAARRKIDYVHWLDNPMLMSLFKEFFKDLIQVKGVKIELRPFHLASAEPKLPLTSSYLRMQVRGNVKAWDIHPPEDLREMSFSQINAALDEDDWAITIYGVEHDMAPSPSTPASRKLMRFVESLTEYKTNIYGWLKRNGKWRFFPREDDHATKIMLWVQHIYKGLSKHQVHGALLGRSLRNIKPPSNTVGHLISWIHGGQGYAVQEHFSDGFLKMKRVSNYSREEMCTIYLFHYHPDPVEEPASQSTINKDDDKMDVNVPDDRDGYMISQQEFSEKITPAPVPAREDDSRLTPAEVSDLRSILGALLWVTATRLDVIADVSALQSRVTVAEVKDLKQANNVLMKVKEFADVGLHYRYFRTKHRRLVCFHDASAASKGRNYAQEGVVIALADDEWRNITIDFEHTCETEEHELMHGGVMHVLHSHGAKAKRVSYSTSHGETLAMVNALESATLCMIRLSEMLHPQHPPSLKDLIKIQTAGNPEMPLDMYGDARDVYELIAGLIRLHGVEKHPIVTRVLPTIDFDEHDLMLKDEEMILKAEKDESMVRTTHASVLVGLAAFATSKKMLAAMLPTLAFGTLVDAQSNEPENQEQKSYFSVYLMIFITVILAVMLERMVTSWMSKKRRIQPVKIESDDDDDMDVDQEGDQPSSSGASFQRKRKASPRDTWEDLARKVIDEKETLKRKNKKSEEDAHLQQQEIDSLKFDNEWWKDKYEKLEEKYDDKDFELKNLKNDMTVVNARKMVLESTVSNMRAGLVKLEDENAELKMKLDRKTAASSERPAPLTPRITDNAEMAGEIEKLQKMVKFKDQEIMRHLARIKSLELPEAIFITKTGKKFHREGCPHLREGEHVSTGTPSVQCVQHVRPMETLSPSPTGKTIRLAQWHKNHAGARYQGEVSIATGQREGKGTYYYTNPYFIYEGDWLDGKKHGQGRLSFGEDGFYEGSFEGGEISGFGRQELNGWSYEGQFLQGQKHGEGTLNKADGGTYTGGWSQGKYSGEGTLKLPSGERYTGGFQAHRFHGHGRHEVPKQGMTYDGAFEAGLRHGYGELQERHGASSYSGHFEAGKRHGQGKSSDQVSGISYEGAWNQDQPERPAATWDLCPPDSEESYTAVGELLKEEAATQLNANPKDKGKKAPPPVDTSGQGPELKGTKGQVLPETRVRLLDATQAPVTEEVGRCFRVTMYKERKTAEGEVLRRPVNFGDARPTYTDPLDEADAPPQKSNSGGKKGGKASPMPDEEVVPPFTGHESLSGAIGPNGSAVLGGNEDWLLPVHLLPAVYWLRLEDATKLEGSIWEALPPLEIPFRVEA
ncbi:unnamed protein product [Durusdinium trenchii]|uniref:CCHC-type domain-containing protein n=1 Tax=Durusdinium trenchii TaxID=1381693 RepID=A0ABP0I8S1_9DINO